jgi:hypothetical protein
MDSSENSKKNFFKFIFNFDNDTKNELLNILQYCFLALIPIIGLNKLISKYIPEPDDTKGNLELTAEVVIQLIVMLFGFFYIHRFVDYFPTFSGVEYPQYSLIVSILTLLLLVFTMQTKIGIKTNILIDRLKELWDGKPATKKDKSRVKVSQPIAGKMPPMITSSPTSNAVLQQSYTDGTAINSLPTSDTMAPQQLPNYNDFYEKDTTPLVNAASPGQTEGFDGPMAANSVLGGSFGSAW